MPIQARTREQGGAYSGAGARRQAKWKKALLFAKRSKNFGSLAYALNGANALMNKSFLVLFCKKERLLQRCSLVAPAAALFAQDATLEDPVGSERLVGHAAIATFYERAMAMGATLELRGPVRVAGDCAAFAFTVFVNAPARRWKSM
jgi:hypothetical protein